jgi:hypothetical protein
MDSLAGIRFGTQIAAAARASGLDPRLLAAVAAQETGGPGQDSGANIVGDGGHGHGLFQLDDRYHPFARTASAMDPGANAQYAGKFLSGLIRQFGGNLRAALSAYNAGSPDATGTTTTWPDGSRLGYADSVMRHLTRLESRDQLLADASGGVSPAPSIVPQSAAPSPASNLAALPASMLLPAPQIPAFTPSGQTFRSFSTEYHDGGGSIADQDDKKMSGAVDPFDDSNS